MIYVELQFDKRDFNLTRYHGIIANSQGIKIPVFLPGRNEFCEAERRREAKIEVDMPSVRQKIRGIGRYFDGGAEIPLERRIFQQRQRFCTGSKR